jgi:hypothetical protein
MEAVMREFGISRESGSPRTPRKKAPPSSLPLILAQIVVGSLVAWAITGLLMLFFWLGRDAAPIDALSYAALIMAILTLVFGIFTLAGGGIATQPLRLEWAGVPVLTRGSDKSPGGGLTALGLCLVVSIELLATFLLTS